MKLESIRKEITPPIGTRLAGYAPDVVAIAVHDPLELNGLFLDDGRGKLLLLSFDLLGLDADFIQELRRSTSSQLKIPPEAVIVTCTHTHSGPHTRSIAGCRLDEEYLNMLRRIVAEAVAELHAPAVECAVWHYSGTFDWNVNRRVILSDNRCEYLPCRKELAHLATGVRDLEAGFLVFTEEKTGIPCYIIANYAAHPLTCQSDGLSGRLISSDYPGVFRRAVRRELGTECMFVSGACGDLHPRSFESGFHQTDTMGEALAEYLIRSVSDILRQPARFRYPDPSLKVLEVPFPFHFRSSPPCVEGPLPLYRNQSAAKLPLALAAIGGTALVGVPGELLCEPGLEIKWHSPYTHTMILYNSTGYLSYICHANAFVSGGYESETSHLDARSALHLVQCAVDGLFAMKQDQAIPEGSLPGSSFS